ncbi:inner membrane protein import complex subunit Tim54-domain-containing protein [Earliella scabrosa]|nr:inner membrane protein import complex subunit Tim54-domain-containing protein [Earliella scabrosa]
MGSNAGDSVFPTHKPPQSGVRTVPQYTGIPPSWLDKRPGLPSRNWLIFLSVTSAVTGYYIYDRQQCKKIRQEYVDKVKDVATQPLGSVELPCKVTVYGAKWLGDEDYDRSMRYFRKYPVLVAAAIDYDMIKGRKLGDIARRVDMLGLDQPISGPMKLPGSSPEGKRQRWSDGGLECMAGLKRGWTDGLEVVDREEQLARMLEEDGKFDEPEPDFRQMSPYSVLPTQNLRAPTPHPKSADSIPSRLNAPPAAIPPHPPMLLVSFTNHIGFTQIPIMIWDFFNERAKLVIGNTRPFSAPPPEVLSPSPTDLDFDREPESYYKKSLDRDFLSEIESARKSYYKPLVENLETARAFARDTREPTKEERNHPPPTEVELRAERLKKEMRWRSDEEGFNIIRPDKDPRLQLCKWVTVQART